MGTTTMTPTIQESKVRKQLTSPEYNYVFDKRNGVLLRWGETVDDDPQFSPYGPEILDLEISVDGCPNNCPFCYKNNTPKPPTNMSFETFQKIFHKFKISDEIIELTFDNKIVCLEGKTIVVLSNGARKCARDLIEEDDVITVEINGTLRPIYTLGLDIELSIPV